MEGARTRSSFNGFLQEVPGISVDNFEGTDSRAYFLSHCHTDHTQGLFSEGFLDHLRRNNFYVYMSENSAAIIKHESVNKDIVDYIKPLQIGEPPITITVPGDDANQIEELYVSVTLVPAGHCFGSVMFLFTTEYKTILYTGDFRISENNVSKYAQLHENGDVIKINALYIDTTFQDDDHDDFPTRTDSVELVIRYIKKWLSESDSNQVALHTSANYGYEFVYNQIYKSIGEKVYLDDRRWELYSQFPDLVPGVTNDEKSRIHRCKNRHEVQSHEKCFPNPKPIHGTPQKYLYIHFSAYKWKQYTIEDHMIQIKKGPGKYRIDVCFATHCSKNELEYFVNYLNPKVVFGFPKEYVWKKSSIKEDKYENGEERTDLCKEMSEMDNSSPVKVPIMFDEEIVNELFGHY